jgi:hypothetical protein
MIIIHIDAGMTKKEINAKIAMAIVNIQKGKVIITEEGIQEDGPEYNVFIHEDSKYVFEANGGYIVEARKRVAASYKPVFECMKKFPNSLFRASISPNSTNFMKVYNIHRCIRPKISTDISNGWMSVDFTALYAHVNNQIQPKSASSHISVVISDGTMLNFTETTELTRPLVFADFKRYHQFVNIDSPIGVDDPAAGIAPVYLAYGIPLTRWFKCTEFSHGLSSTIYVEDWKNITLCRTPPKDNPIPFNTFANSSFNKITEDLSELRNVACGAPPSFENVCCSCYVPLFDDIYVIETGTRHIGVCPKCIYGIKIAKDWTILRTVHPRSAVQAVLESDASELVKQTYVDFLQSDRPAAFDFNLTQSSRKITVNSPNVLINARLLIGKSSFCWLGDPLTLTCLNMIDTNHGIILFRGITKA